MDIQAPIWLETYQQYSDRIDLHLHCAQHLPTPLLQRELPLMFPFRPAPDRTHPSYPVWMYMKTIEDIIFEKGKFFTGRRTEDVFRFDYEQGRFRKVVEEFDLRRPFKFQPDDNVETYGKAFTFWLNNESLLMHDMGEKKKFAVYERNQREPTYIVEETIDLEKHEVFDMVSFQMDEDEQKVLAIEVERLYEHKASAIKTDDVISYFQINFFDPMTRAPVVDLEVEFD